MFSYCLNNPVLLYDPSGAMARISKDMAFTNGGLWGGGGLPGYTSTANGRLGASISDFFDKVEEIVSNTSEQKVHDDLKSKGVSFYKGTPVMKADWMGGVAMSFMVIVMGSENLTDPGFANTLNHEYGHVIHLAMIGPIDYFATTAIPSLLGAAIAGDDTAFQRFVSDNYHSLPWERTANIFGGVNKGNSPAANIGASLFWLWTITASSGTPF